MSKQDGIKIVHLTIEQQELLRSVLVHYDALVVAKRCASISGQEIVDLEDTHRIVFSIIELLD